MRVIKGVRPSILIERLHGNAIGPENLPDAPGECDFRIAQVRRNLNWRPFIGGRTTADLVLGLAGKK